MRGLPEVEPRTGRGARGRRWAWVAGAAIAVVLTALLAGPPATGRPGDPRSTTYGGLRGILDVASSLGRQVDIAVELPGDATTSYLLVVDDLGPEERDRVRDWVADGGRLVVADPGSPLAEVEPVGRLLTDLFGATRYAAGCDLLPEVDRLQSTSWIALEIPAGADACVLLEDEGAWLVRRASGAGEIVALGGPGPLANEHLDDEDNALAGIAVLAPQGDDRLLVRPLPEPGSGDSGLLDLLPRRVRHLLVGLALVYGVLVWWRGRRLGPPAPEPLPLRIPGAAIVDGVAGLLQRSGDRAAVAGALQDEVRRALADALGLPVGTVTDAELAGLAGARLGSDPGTVSAALAATPADDEELVALARRCEELLART